MWSRAPVLIGPGSARVTSMPKPAPGDRPRRFAGRFVFRIDLGSYDANVSQKSESTNPGAPRVCSIADALEVVGERWSLLVLRELGFGVHRFTDIQVNTGAPRETLALRLRKLEEAGVIERRRYSDRPPRDEYVLTAVGRDLFPVLSALREWGEQHVTPARGLADDTAGVGA
jgi:DNA-binding HxlR family transcriptional regulator